MVSEYLNKLKAKNGDTYESIEEKSGIPLSTIKNIFSGKTPNPRFDTIVAIFKAMGGSFDEMYEKNIQEDYDMNTDDKSNVLYEQRIKDIKESHGREISLLKDHIKSLEEDKSSLKFVAGFSCVALVFFLVMVLVISNAR